jgi:hypothetical protein
MAYEVTNKSTVHGSGTPHGLGVPHRYPTAQGENLTDIMSGLARQLYPTGRAWWMRNNGVFDNLHKAINRSFIRVLNDSDLTIDSCFPDNANFDENDATLWEYRLGLTTNTSLSLELRKDAILRKMAYPKGIEARQNKLFIENQLRLAGFDVYVHENLPPYQTPDQIVALSLELTQHGGGTQHGIGTQHGYINFDVIANEAIVNESFSVGSLNLWSTFFIGGENLGDMASVPNNRLIEFKELVLKLKPAHTAAYTFINYV